MAATAATSLAFKVKRGAPELVPPAKSTPHELKQLSDVDGLESNRFHMPLLQFYRHNPLVDQGGERDPVEVIREAIAKTLVFYYPFAGRLREGPNGKLLVDCTGEGALFIEADADVTLEQFGDPIIHPPVPCLEELVFNVPGSDGILDCPLLFIQVTRLKCNGFIVALRFNHTMADATGLAQFWKAMGEMARGAAAPSIHPVWQRELLNARDPPRITCPRNEYINIDAATNNASKTPFQLENDFPLFEGMAHRTFLLGPGEFRTIGRYIPPHLRPFSKFEVLTACLWRCKALAIQAGPKDQIGIKIAVNARPKFEPPLPAGYYGNAYANKLAVTTAGKLFLGNLGHALELIREAKNTVTEEYMRSSADPMVIQGRHGMLECCNVSDVKHVGFDEVDYGWGKPVFAGQPKGWTSDHIPAMATFYLPFKNEMGEQGIMMLVSLPKSVMERFVAEFEKMLQHQPQPRL